VREREIGGEREVKRYKAGTGDSKMKKQGEGWEGGGEGGGVKRAAVGTNGQVSERSSGGDGEVKHQRGRCVKTCSEHSSCFCCRLPSPSPR